MCYVRNLSQKLVWSILHDDKNKHENKRPRTRSSSLFFLTVEGQIAVFVTEARSRSEAEPVEFVEVSSNLGSLWSREENKFTFTSSTDGIFYMALSAGSLSRNIGIDYNIIIAGSPFASCSRAYGNSWVHETTARDIMVRLKPKESVHMSTMTGVADFKATSLGLFSVTDVMEDDLVAFSVSRDSGITGHADPLPLPVISLNEGAAYDVSGHCFIAPSTGIYFFSVSVGARAQQPTYIIVSKNRQKFVDLRRDSTVHNGNEVIARSVMMTLNQGDTVHLSNAENSITWSSALKETSFNGFCINQLMA